MVVLPSPGASAIPLAVEPVLGWRTWGIEWGADGTPILSSPMLGMRWEPRKPVAATCRTPVHRHQAPLPNCSCGVYAVSRLERLPGAIGRASTAAIAVVGSVALWGRVIEHARGYRAGFAYPSRIRLACRRCLLAGWVGAPDVVELDEDRRPRPVCSAHVTPGAAPARCSPAELQQMVLDAYAVDLLPVEALHRAGFRRDPVPVAGLVAAARSEARELTRTSAGWILLVLAFLAYLGMKVVELPQPGGPSDVPSTSAPVVDLPASGALPAELTTVPNEDDGIDLSEDGGIDLDIGFVCGHRIGGRVLVMSCARARAESLGTYRSPAEPKGECWRSWGYSMKPSFSVCWFWPRAWRDGDVEVLGLPGVHLRDL